MNAFFTFELTSQTIGIAVLIFVLRVLEMSLDTLRVLFTLRGKKLRVWLIGFIRSAIFVMTIAFVLQNVENVFSVIAYAAGFATGNILGMWFEERLALGFVELRIVSPRRGQAILESLRDEGYAVTELLARGKDGMVSVLSCTVQRKTAPDVEEVIQKTDQNAFITAEEVRSVRRGFWGT